MRVNELMSSPAISVEPGLPLKEVAEVMLHHGVSTVPVVDTSDGIIGIVSQTDLLTIQAHRSAAPLAKDEREVRIASDLMTRAVISTAPETSLDDLVRLMLEHNVKRVPVVADGRLIGMISRTDVIRVLTRPDDDIAREVAEALRHDGLLIDPIGFEVSHGVVTFSGVSAPGLRAHLRGLAYAIAGVIGVDVARAVPEGTAEGDSRALLAEVRAG
jgi:CBS domain-containing protein